MNSKGGTEEKFSNHPCHRLSVPAAKRFWCRHCFEMFDDPISRWRHSKTCKNTGLSNLTRRKEQEATALQAYCESAFPKKPEHADDNKQVILPNLNPRSTNKSYIGPKENNAVDLSCFICRRQFSTMEEMKDHVRVPCNKAGPLMSDDLFPFPTRASSARGSASEIIYRTASTSGEGTSSSVYEIEDEEATPSNKRTPSPLDPSNLSSETMAAVEALNMMARSDKVNLTQFLNQLSEGGFVIEQAAGTSGGSDSQDREIVFTVQGDVGESGDLLQHGGDITVEVAEDLIRMAQRVRVEAVERVVEEQVQEEVVQEDLEQTEVQYIQDQAQFIEEQPQYEDQAQYVGQSQYVEEQPQYVQEQAQMVKVEPLQQETEYVEADAQFVQEQAEYITEQSENVQPSSYTIMNVETGKEFTGQIITEGQLSNVGMESLPENAQVFVVPIDHSIVTKEGAENLLSIPDGKRKLEEDISTAEGEVQVKLENGSQVKKICSEVVIEQSVSDSNVEEEAFEAKKKLQFFSERLIVQEKCNKKFEPTEKTLKIKSKEPCETESVEKSSDLLHDETDGKSAQTPDTDETRSFLDEIDGCFKPMTEEMIKTEEKMLDMSTLMPIECMITDEKMTVIKKKPCRVKHPPPSPKKLRSSSRKLMLTPKKKRLMEDKEKRKKKNIKGKTPIHKQQKTVKSKQVEPTVKKEPVPEEPVSEPVEKPKKVQPPKQHKCRACDKVFNSLKLLQKHKTVPCVVKITRNLCQKILRPKRALPKPPVKKVIKKKIVKHVKDSKKPKLLPVGFQIQAQWIPCKRERKPSKGRGRPRKHSVHYERKKRIILPDRTIEVSSLSDKEQFFFELGLVCSDYIRKEFRRPLPQTSAEITTSLSVRVDQEVSEDKSSVDDISPPLLEKMEPTHVNKFESSQPPDLFMEEEELEPPLLEPFIQDMEEEELEPPLLEPFIQDMKHDVPKQEVIEPLIQNVNGVIPKQEEHKPVIQDMNSEVSKEKEVIKPLSEKMNDDGSEEEVAVHSQNEMLPVEEELTNSKRHFLDSFSSEEQSEQDDDTESMSVLKKRGEAAPSLEIASAPLQVDSIAKESPNRANIIQQLKTTLKTICSPQKPGCSAPSPRQKATNASNISPQIKRNLFETLQTMCSGSNQTSRSQASPSSPQVSVSRLCTGHINLVDKISPKKKCHSAHSSPKKIPNILLRRSASESASRDQMDSILDIVAKSMGVTVSDSRLSPPIDQDSNEEISPSKATRLRSASFDQTQKSTDSSPSKCKKNLFDTCESLLRTNSSRSEAELADDKSHAKRNLKHTESKNSNPGKLSELSNAVHPLVSLSTSQTGQILVSPLEQDKCDNTIKTVPVNHRGVKRKLCDAATQCERAANTSPVKAMLGQLEHRLKLLKTALKTQTTLRTEAETSCGVRLKEKKNLLPELVSVILKQGPGESSSNSPLCKTDIGDGEDKNLPDVVRCVTEKKNRVDNVDSSRVNKTFLDRVSDENATDASNGATMSLTNSEDSSDRLSESEQDDDSSDSSSSGSKVKVQYIDQLESNGVTYLLIQREGMEDYLTSLGDDLDLDSGDTIHAVTVEEDVLTETIPSKLYTSQSRTCAVDHEVFVNSSGF